MRDIQMVLERWGAWAANNHEDVTWSSDPTHVIWTQA